MNLAAKEIGTIGHVAYKTCISFHLQSVSLLLPASADALGNDGYKSVMLQCNVHGSVIYHHHFQKADVTILTLALGTLSSRSETL